MTGQPETIELALENDGEHLILVREFFGQAGAYQIQLMAIQAEQPLTIGNLTYGQTAEGTLTRQNGAAWFFKGEAGDTVSIVLEATLSAHDPSLSLVAPNGDLFIAVDDRGSGQVETLTSATLTEDGLWQIVVEEFYGQASAYTLSLQEEN